MVQPVRLVLGFSTILSIVVGTTRAGAEPLAPACRMGLVLGVSDQDAGDVVAAVCNAAKKRGTAGVVRVSVLAAGNRVRVGVARLADTAEPEQSAHAEAADVGQAIRIAPSVLEALDPKSMPPPPPSPPPPPLEVEAEPPPPKEQSTTPFEAKAGPPAPWIGVHGSSGVAGGGSGFGAGGAVGFDHRSVQAFIDYSNSSGSADGKFSHHLATIGGRLKLSQSSFQPVIGGGWSYVDYERGQGIGKTAGQGIGIFAEAGAMVAMGKHRIIGLARLNLGLYEERTTQQYSYATYNGDPQLSTYESRSGDSPVATFAFLGGYAYVFR